MLSNQLRVIRLPLEARPAEANVDVLDDVVLDGRVGNGPTGEHAVIGTGIVAAGERSLDRSVGVIAFEREPVDGDVGRGDGENRVRVAVGFDDRFAAAAAGSGHAGVGPVDGQRLVDCHVFVEEPGGDDDGTARVRQIYGALNRLPIGDVDGAGLHADVTERGIRQIIMDLAFDREDLRLGRQYCRGRRRRSRRRR